MKRVVLTLIMLLGVLAVRAGNTLSVTSASGHPQDEVTIHVSLANTTAAVAFQTEIPLGSQLSYVPGSVALNPARITDHQVTAAVVNGNLRIYVFSLSLTPFVGSQGNLLSFTLKLKNEPGDYPLSLSNSILSSASSTSIPFTPQNGQVTILSPKLQINTMTIDYGHVPIRSEYTRSASVTNVGNEPLTISGITFSDPVFSCPSFSQTTLQPNSSVNFTFKFAPMVKGALTATATVASNSISGNGIINLISDPFAVNELHIDYVTGYCDSVVEVPINMNNMESIIGFQIDMNLPDQLEFVDFELSNRKTDHVSSGVFNEGLLRMMAYSPSGSAFTGDDGLIGTLRLRLKGLYGNYYLNPFKAVLADVNGENVLSAKYQGRVTIRSPKINGNASLDMGSSPVTETVTKEYVVYNNGNATMRIDQIVFDQPDFAVAETFPITVNQYSNKTLHVSYCREQAGNFNALMKIYSNDPENGLKNVTLSGNRYEPNTLALTADAVSYSNGDVAVALAMSNYSGIVAMQADFHYPSSDYSVAASDFQLTNRFSSHSLLAMPLNDSTYRILVYSLLNSTVDGHEGDALSVTLHPVGTSSLENYTVSVANVVLSGIEGVNLYTGNDVSASFSVSAVAMHAAALSQGWNWWSTYIEQNGIDGLSMLENSLGGNGLRILSKSNGYVEPFEYNGTLYWYGTLDAITNEQMYMVRTNTACNAAMRGQICSFSDHPITINNGWNWIGFPSDGSISVSTALSGFSPAENDQIKSKSNGYSTYIVYGSNAVWYGTLNTLDPGKGYMYKSNSNMSKTLVFQQGRDEVLQRNVSADDNSYQPEESEFASNMTVTAIVELNGVELHSEDFELAAFVGNECRGSVKLMYVEPLNRYLAFLLVSGESEERLRFVLTDGTNAYWSEDHLTYAVDGTVGTPLEPAVLHFDLLSANEDGLCPVIVYPNPSNGVFNVEGNGLRKAEVVNAYGQVVCINEEKGFFMQIDLSGYADGAYLLRVVTDKGVNTQQIIKK